MGSYSVPAGHIGAHAKTLVPSTVDTVTFLLGTVGTPGWGSVPKAVEVLTDGASDVYVTTDGTAPTVGGTNCFRIPAMAGGVVVDVVSDDRLSAPAAVVVKLISAGVATYSVSRAR